MSNYETIILSLGGSLIVPNGAIDTEFLKSFNTFVRDQIAETNRRFFIVCGGGGTARHYMKAGKEIIGQIEDEDIDWLGIHATRLNAHLLRTVFHDVSYPPIVENYDKTYQPGQHRVIIGAGWQPGCSTDYDSVLAAERFDADVVVNMSNISHVYDKDPKRHSDAKEKDAMTWKEYKKIAGNTWVPGMNLPFDPIATKKAADLGLTVVILQGKPLKYLEDYMSGKQFVGTTIS